WTPVWPGCRTQIAGEGGQPDEVVGEDGQAEGERQFAGRGGPGEANRAECFAEDRDGDEVRVLRGTSARPPVAGRVHEHEHPNRPPGDEAVWAESEWPREQGGASTLVVPQVRL